MNYVYILECSDKTLYTGWTTNLNKRVKKHNNGNGAKYTRGRLPVKVKYFKKYSTRSEAMKREYAIKQLTKSKKKKLIKNFERSNSMDKIESFEVNHLNLDPGLYVSRKDSLGKEVLTTFDLRLTKPNDEPVMNTAPIHTIEHIGATFLRNHEEYSKDIIYFGPMGCRTGFYLIIKNDLESKDIVPLVKDMFEFIVDFEGDIPGENAKECGNYLDQNLKIAKYYSKRYLENVLNDIKAKQMKY